MSNTTKGATGQSSKTSTCLIAAQVVLGCFLLIVSGTYAYQNIYQTYLSRGVDTGGLSTATVALDGHYSHQAERIGYLNALQDGLASVGGLNGVAYTTALPDMYSPPVTVAFEEGEDASQSAEQIHVVTHVSDNYFTTVDLPILQGRAFDQQDASDTEAVVIVDEFFARKFWPNASAIGKRVLLKSAFGSNWYTIVGVSAHVRRQVADSRFTLYRPLRQQVPSFPNELLLLIDHDQPLSAIRQELAATASSINRNIPLTNILPIEAYQIATWGWRMVQSRVFAWTYFVVLFLVALSIFAVLSRTIVQRIRDIGVRRALGSSNQTVIALYVRRGFLFVIFGSAIGTGLALLTSDWLMDLRSADEFPNFIADVSTVVITTLALFILVATYLPARRAISMEPGDALRDE